MRKCIIVLLVVFLQLNLLHLSLASIPLFTSQNLTQLLRISLTASPFACILVVLSHHYYHHFSDEQLVTAVEEEWVRAQLKSCGSDIPHGIKLTTSDQEPAASPRLDRIVLNRLWLKRAQETLEIEVKAQLQGALLHAIGHIKNDDPRHTMRVALAVPTVVQGGMTACGLVVKKINNISSVTPNSLRVCARFTVLTGTSVGSILSVFMYARYREICADNEVKYHPQQGRAMAHYLFEKEKTLHNNIFYHLNNTLYEIMSSQPLPANRARRLERYAQKTEKILDGGGSIPQEAPPSFIRDLKQLIVQQFEGLRSYAQGKCNS